jgi:hypothetical protein
MSQRIPQRKPLHSVIMTVHVDLALSNARNIGKGIFGSILAVYGATPVIGS